MEAKRLAIAHVLRISGDAISIQVPWRPTATVDPNLACYTALSDFHCRVMTSAHRDSPHARRPPNPGGTAERAGYTSFAPSSGRPNHVMGVVTQPECKTTVQGEVPTRSEVTNVTKSAVGGVINQEKMMTTTSHRQAVKLLVLPVVYD